MSASPKLSICASIGISDLPLHRAVTDTLRTWGFCNFGIPGTWHFACWANGVGLFIQIGSLLLLSYFYKLLCLLFSSFHLEPTIWRGTSRQPFGWRCRSQHRVSLFLALFGNAQWSPKISLLLEEGLTYLLFAIPSYIVLE